MWLLIYACRHLILVSQQTCNVETFFYITMWTPNSDASFETFFIYYAECVRLFKTSSRIFDFTLLDMSFYLGLTKTIILGTNFDLNMPGFVSHSLRKKFMIVTTTGNFVAVITQAKQQLHTSKQCLEFLVAKRKLVFVRCVTRSLHLFVFKKYDLRMHWAGVYTSSFSSNVLRYIRPY